LKTQIKYQDEVDTGRMHTVTWPQQWRMVYSPNFEWPY